MKAPLRVVFFGSDAIALPLLNSLATPLSPARVVAVFTQPDRAVGRGQQMQPNAIKAWALGQGLSVFQPEKITEDVRLQLAQSNADVGLVMAYGHILRDDFIATLPLGMLNLHTSLLPKYRGASPIQSAVASGDRETGVTLMRIVRRLDAGPIADLERVAIGPLDTAADIESKLAAACVPLIGRALPRLADGTLSFTAQDDALATFCRKLSKEDGVLDFAAPATVLSARINGLFPWPACTAEINQVTVKLGLADAIPLGAPTPNQAHAPGTIIGAKPDGLLVATGEGVLRLRKLQRPGGRMLVANEFLRGFAVAPGTVIPSRRMPLLVTRK